MQLPRGPAGPCTRSPSGTLYRDRLAKFVRRVPSFSRPAQVASRNEMERLCSVLAAYTSTADRCFLGIWEGYGGLPLSEWASGSELRLDQRTFLVTEGPISTATRVDWRDPGALLPEPPTLMWPADRAWFVASDVDLDSTYVGGSEDLIAAVLAEPGLEAWPANSTDRVSIDSDSINAM
jgi:hypothetical protein